MNLLTQINTILKLKKMNKKATGKIMSLYWFVILFLVAAAIVYMVAIFQGEPLDVRKIEAQLLTDHVANCLSQGGDLDQQLLDDEGNFILRKNFLTKCNLNFNSEEIYEWDNDQYYIEVKIYPFGSSKIFREPIQEGNIDLKDNCNLADTFPYCMNRTMYILDKNLNGQTPYKINIFTSIRKIEKNAK